jgi:hypothetical protein
MFLDTSFNSLSTVFSNIYNAFIETATKMWRYAKCLLVQKQPGAQVIISECCLICNVNSPKNPTKTKRANGSAKKQKHTTVGIRWSSPTQLLIHRSEACVWQSGRDAQFSLVCGRMWKHYSLINIIILCRLFRILLVAQQVCGPGPGTSGLAFPWLILGAIAYR